MDHIDETSAIGVPPPPFRMVPYFLPPKEFFSAEQMKYAYIARIELLQKIAQAEKEFYDATLAILKK
jgi:hypothetical protein